MAEILTYEDNHRIDRYLENCDFIKTVLMLVVVAYHCTIFWTQSAWFNQAPERDSILLGLFADWVGSFHIYAFTLVSGYIFAFKIAGGGYSQYISFLANKAKRLLVPYVFVMLIWVAPISEYFFNWDLNFLVKKYIFCINPSQLWFLWMLFWVFAIVWPLKKVIIERPIVGLCIAMVFYGVGIIGEHFLPNVFCIFTAFHYVLFFCIGMNIRMNEEKDSKSIMERIPWYFWIILDFIVFVGMMIAGLNNGIVWKLVERGLEFMLHIIGAIMAWTTLQTLAINVSWKSSRVFKTLFSYSMPMYLFHQQIIYFTISWLNGKINPWINAGVNFVAALSGSFLISSFLMRFKVTRKLIGEK